MKARLQPGWRLSDGERATLAEIGKRLGRKGLEQVARLAQPDTILAWYRRLVAEKFDQFREHCPHRVGMVHQVQFSFRADREIRPACRSAQTKARR